MRLAEPCSLLSSGGAALALAASCWAGVVTAGGLELDLHVGRTMPTFEQSLTLDRGFSNASSGVSLTPQGPLVLDAKGSTSFSGSLTWFVAGPVGIEARVDSLTTELVSEGVRYDLLVRASPPIPSITGEVDVAGEGLGIESLRPVSLNLRIVTSGPVRLSLAGGVARLGPIRTKGALTGTTQVTVGGITLPALAARVALRAEAAPDLAERGQYGVTAGLGVQIGLGPHLALSGEARGFLFKERELVWSSAAPPSDALASALEQELLARLTPVRFTPTFFSVNLGLALRF